MAVLWTVHPDLLKKAAVGMHLWDSVGKANSEEEGGEGEDKMEDHQK